MFDLLYISIDDGDGNDVDHVAHRTAEVGEMDGFVQSHLDGTDDFHVGIERLQHLVR